jgi:hypothetical protein
MIGRSYLRPWNQAREAFRSVEIRDFRRKTIRATLSVK